MKRTFYGILMLFCLVLFLTVFTVKPIFSLSGVDSIEASDVVTVDSIALPIFLVTFEKATVPQIRENIFVKEKTHKSINTILCAYTSANCRDKYHMRC